MSESEPFNPEPFLMYKPEPCLPEMPSDVMELIYTSSDFNSRCQLKQVSKTFLGQEKRSPIHYDYAFLELGETQIDLKLGFQNGEQEKKVKLENGFNDIQEATSAFFKIFENKRATFDCLVFGWMDGSTIDTDEVQAQKRRMLDAILQNFRQLGRKIKTKGLILLMNLQVAQIEEFFPFLKMGDLNCLGVKLREETAFEQITGTPLWQQLSTVGIIYSDDVPLEQFHGKTDGLIVGAKGDLDDLKALTQAFLRNLQQFDSFEIHELTDFQHLEFISYIRSLTERRDCVIQVVGVAFLEVTVYRTAVFFKKHKDRPLVLTTIHHVIPTFRPGRHLL